MKYMLTSFEIHFLFIINLFDYVILQRKEMDVEDKLPVRPPQNQWLKFIVFLSSHIYHAAFVLLILYTS